MALSAAAVQLARAHAQAQRRIGIDTVRTVLNAWQLLDLERLDDTTADWMDVVVPIVNDAGRRSAQLAAGYFQANRMLAGFTDQFAPPIATVNEQALRTSLLVTGPVSVKQAMTRGIDLATAGDVASARSAASAMRHAMDAGRETVLESARSDRKVVGYARMTTSDKPCEFCEMLADRGAVYGSDTADFQAHDGCGCQPVPAY